MPAYIGRPKLLIIRGEPGAPGLASAAQPLPPSSSLPISTISQAFEPVQDGVNPRIWTIAKSLVPESVRCYLEGQRLRTSLSVISVAGGVTTITLHATVPASLGDFLEVEGAEATA